MTPARAPMPRGARMYTTIVTALGGLLLVVLFPQRVDSPLLFALLLALSGVTSVWQIELPILRGGSARAVPCALDFISLLLLGTPETMLMAAARAYCDTSYAVKVQPRVRETLFRMAGMVLTVLAAGAAYTALGGGPGDALYGGIVVRPLVFAAATYFAVSTVLEATAVALSTAQPIDRVWAEQFLWSAPAYVIGAGAAALTLWVMAAFPSRWLILLAGIPFYLAYRTYKVYLRRLEASERHARELADLHLATIEALALAIDAKDQTSQSHIRRVQLYAATVAASMGMSESEVQGVKTAALLHDIGKLAVPEHILSKSGPLTPEEFQKIRAHPRIGADIVSSVPFPYPVAPLILSHHEQWDGKGYPSGLKGVETPLGARILAVVDRFDAVMTDRPHQKALSYETAIALIREDAGRALDPEVVSVFLDLLPSLREQACARGDAGRSVESGLAVRGGGADLIPNLTFMEDIALAHQEIYALYEMAQTMGTSLGVEDTMALITSKLSSLVPYSCAALFLHDEATRTLSCRFATGMDADLIQRVTVRSGEGVTGWVARNRRPMVNARPAVDFVAAGIRNAESSLLSALICPLVFNGKLIGTLSVYHVEPTFFRDDHRRLLDRVSEQAAAVINNAILFEQTQVDSLTDVLTGLPNTRHLFTHLTRELARSRRLGTEVALLVMDLDSFKDINDTHGHHVGDRALCEVAKVLRAGIRPYDICVRYAGDEFIVVLSGCRLEEAELKRAELQKMVEDVQFEARAGRPLPLGISVGIAIFSRDGDSYETLLATADSRMYQDKAGRKQRQATRDTPVLLNGNP